MKKKTRANWRNYRLSFYLNLLISKRDYIMPTSRSLICEITECRKVRNSLGYTYPSVDFLCLAFSYLQHIR